MHKLIILLISATSVFIILVLFFFIFWFRKKCLKKEDMENSEKKEEEEEEAKRGGGEMITFEGGEELTIDEILEAPGEVIGKSSYGGTLYKALLQRSQRVRLLRFLRPSFCQNVEDFDRLIQFLGCIRHRNLVPLLGFYTGQRGEKLLVYPFYTLPNLHHFITVGNAESHKWGIIYKISLGIAKGLDHLHTGLHKPIIHGNLKSKNILLDRNYEPHVSDFGLHLLLDPSASQEMLQVSATCGYRAPELIKTRDASEQTDIYSFGVILLELLSGKKPINHNPTPSLDEDIHDLPNYVRNAILDHRISGLFHPDILVSDRNNDGSVITEEQLLECFQLALECCSSLPALRPNIKQVIAKLEEIRK